MKKPDTVFQKLYDTIKDYNNPQLVKMLGKLQNEVIDLLKKNGIEETIKILQGMINTCKIWKK